MRVNTLSLLTGAVATLVVAGCTAGTSSDVFSSGGGGSGVATGQGGMPAQGSTVAVADTSAAQFMSGTGSTGGGTCNATAEEDQDGDGWTITQGDCNDCDANVNPGALEVIITTPDSMGMIPTPADEDCDGTVDNPPPATCDDNIPIDSIPALDGARAIELCKQSTGPKDWGVVQAAYVRAGGAAAQPTLATGILDGFGPNVHPQKGTRILGMSSGYARVPGQMGACGTQSCNHTATAANPGAAPTGFPQASPNCAIDTVINDDIGLQVELRAPSNATGYKFDFKFYSFEYPEWVCTNYNDQFIALVAPAPMGSVNGNISFDSQNSPVSVDNAFFQVCSGCALGTMELVGTGFEPSPAGWNDAGATAWLETQAPVKGGEDFTIRFAIWDTGDTAFDSSVLVDAFEWIASGGTVVTGTTPVPS